MLYNPRKTGVQDRQSDRRHLQTNMRANQGPAKIDLLVGEWRRYVLVDLPGSTIHTRPRVGHAE